MVRAFDSLVGRWPTTTKNQIVRRTDDHLVVLVHRTTVVLLLLLRLLVVETPSCLFTAACVIICVAGLVGSCWDSITVHSTASVSSTY